MSSALFLKKKVLIFGAKGQLGTDLVETLENDYEVIGMDIGETDITKESEVKQSIIGVKPDIIINCAAYTKVEDAENNAELAYKINALGPYYIAKAGNARQAKIILISTNYVFDGEKKSYNEEDLPNPINIYGASKLAGEQLTKIATNNYYIIRTSGLFGNQQSQQKLNFVDLMLNLAKNNKEIKVVNDQHTSLCYTIDLSKKIKELLVKEVPVGIYHVTNANYCTWYEFAVEIFRQKNIDFKIKAITTKESNTKIQRPKSATLENAALARINIKELPTWQDALERYLKAIKI